MKQSKKEIPALALKPAIRAVTLFMASQYHSDLETEQVSSYNDSMYSSIF